MDIYWIADKKKCGPATVPDVLSLVQMGELSPDTKGWHAGCEQWMPLRELPALADFLKPEETPAAPQQDGPETPVAQEPVDEKRPVGIPADAVRVYLPSPTTRFLARCLDMALYVALVFGVVYARQIPFTPSLLPSGPLIWIGFVMLESFLISTLGTTPGKSLLGIHIRCVGEGKMTYGRALSRAFLVFIGGMGMMVSLLPLFMMGYSWWGLRTRGITMWDARCSTLPLMLKPVSSIRMFIAALGIYACFHVSTFCMQPWMESMVTAIEQQSPEVGQMLRGMMPTENPPAEK